MVNARVILPTAPPGLGITDFRVAPIVGVTPTSGTVAGSGAPSEIAQVAMISPPVTTKMRDLAVQLNIAPAAAAD